MTKSDQRTVNYLRVIRRLIHGTPHGFHSRAGKKKPHRPGQWGNIKFSCSPWRLTPLRQWLYESRIRTEEVQEWSLPKLQHLCAAWAEKGKHERLRKDSEERGGGRSRWCHGSGCLFPLRATLSLLHPYTPPYPCACSGRPWDIWQATDREM